MSPEEEKVQKIIRLKRYESPPEGYFDNFLAEFQKRRDEEMQEKKSRAGIFSKGLAWFRGMGTGSLCIGGGLAYAAAIIAVLMWPKGPERRPDHREPIIFQPKPDQTIPPTKRDPKDPPKGF